jgi:hypothetical protein
VQQWRSTQLRAAGYPPWEALVLSCRRNVDLPPIELLRRGCPVDTALRILLCGSRQRATKPPST